MHCAIEGEAASPPAAPQDGEAWLVSANAQGDWTGQDGNLALRQAGTWIFVTPRDGLVVLHRPDGQVHRYHGGWLAPVAPAEPSGGNTVDVQARSVIAQILLALRQAGVFPQA